MDTYHTVMAKVESLQKKAKALLDAEKARVLVEMRKVIDLYGIHASELYPAGSSSDVRARSRKAETVKKLVLKPKYRDPATGKTWNGHGKRPFWLGSNPDAFLIDRPQPTTPTAAVRAIAAKKAAPEKREVAKKALPAKKTVDKTITVPKAKAKAVAKPASKAPVKKKPVAKKVASAQPVSLPIAESTPDAPEQTTNSTPVSE